MPSETGEPTADIEGDYVLRTGQVAKLLGCTPSTVIRYANTGVIRSRRLPGGRRDRRYSEADVLQLIKEEAPSA